MIEIGDCTQLIRGNVRVEWVNLGEGYFGEYDPDDPEDENFLRFDVSVLEDDEWVDPGDASYCTQFPATVSERLQSLALELIMDEVYDLLQDERPIKKKCENLSWISPSWIYNAE